MGHYQLDQSKFLTESELKILCKELKLNRDTDSRNVTIIELAMVTGARASELLALTQADLGDDGTVLIRGLKNSNNRELPIAPSLMRRLRQHVPFGISYRQLARIWDQYRPCAKGIHSLRHTMGLDLYSRHKDLKLVQMVLGHRNIMNSNIYCDYHYKRSELKKLLT